jgi:hypothetical protein
MSSDIEQALLEKVRTLPPEQQRELLRFLEGLAPQPSTEKTVWEEIDESVASAPPGTWDSVPADGAANIDHYLYGTRKK